MTSTPAPFSSCSFFPRLAWPLLHAGERDVGEWGIRQQNEEEPGLGHAAWVRPGRKGSGHAKGPAALLVQDTDRRRTWAARGTQLRGSPNVDRGHPDELRQHRRPPLVRARHQVQGGQEPQSATRQRAGSRARREPDASGEFVAPPPGSRPLRPFSVACSGERQRWTQRVLCVVFPQIPSQRRRGHASMP